MQIMGISFKKMVIVFAGLIVLGTFIWLNVSKEPPAPSASPSPASPTPDQNAPPQIISTKPDPLEDNIVSANQTIEITFNRSLQNSGEFKLKIEPKIDFKIDLSNDRKTARIIFIKPLELGTTYTMFIGPDTKFDGIGEWGVEKNYHFKTITYRGV